MDYDIKNSLTIVNGGAAPVARTSTVTGSGIDLKGYESTVAFVQDVGAVSGTSPTLDGKIQDSADNSSFSDVTGYTFTQVTSSTNTQVLNVDPRYVRRYVRYVGTIAGTTPSFGLAVMAIGKKQVQ